LLTSKHEYQLDKNYIQKVFSNFKKHDKVDKSFKTPNHVSYIFSLQNEIKNLLLLCIFLIGFLVENEKKKKKVLT